jgi:hypothetical protein
MAHGTFTNVTFTSSPKSIVSFSLLCIWHVHHNIVHNASSFLLLCWWFCSIMKIIRQDGGYNSSDTLILGWLQLMRLSYRECLKDSFVKLGGCGNVELSTIDLANLDCDQVTTNYCGSLLWSSLGIPRSISGPRCFESILCIANWNKLAQPGISYYS